jgi:hypothetical protein
MAEAKDAETIERLRKNPCSYSVDIRHFEQDGEWFIGIDLNTPPLTEAQLRGIAWDLRTAALLIEKDAAKVGEKVATNLAETDAAGRA